MEKVKEKTQYVVRLWPKAYRRQPGANSKDLLVRMADLRKKISAVWPKDVNVIDEIRDQRTKPYDFDY